MIVLDTNVVSELMRPAPDMKVLAWVDAQMTQDLWLCSVVVAELAYGVGRMPTGRRKQQLAEALAITLEQDFAGRVLTFDLASALDCASLLAVREQAGRPVAWADAQIAATCLAHGATLATRNTQHFEGLGVSLINPWSSA